MFGGFNIHSRRSLRRRVNNRASAARKLENQGDFVCSLRAIAEQLEPRLLLSGTAYVVDSLADTVANDGHVTLREAIQAANTNLAVNEAPAGSISDPDSITFASSLFASGPGKITLSGTSLSISSAMTVTGPGPNVLTIDGNKLSGVFSISGSGPVDVEGLTVSNGGTLSGTGGGFYLVADNVSLTNCTIKGNRGWDGAGIYVGRGIATLTNSMVSGNSGSSALGSNSLGCGVYVYQGDLTINNCTISGNGVASSAGGGIFVDSGGTITLSNSTVSGNLGYVGAGIAIYGGKLTVANSTVSGNSASYNMGSGGVGGGICASGGATVTLSNSVIAQNSATYWGGGVYLEGSTVTLDDCTISGNLSYSSSGGGIYVYGGIYVPLSSSLTLNNTIVAMNGNSDIVGTWSGHGSLVGIAPGFVRNPSPGKDGKFGTTDDDPGDLHLRQDGLAVNWGRNALAVDGTGAPLQTDLAGNPRIADGQVDAGAYECEGSALPGQETRSLVVTSLSDTFDRFDGLITLREAILYSDWAAGSPAITFDPSLFSAGPATIRLGGTTLTISSSLSIAGPAGQLLTIDAAGLSQVIQIQSGTVTLDDLKITGGAGFITSDHIVITGAVAVAGGQLTLTNSIISGNTAGGLIVSGGVATITHSAISGNTISIGNGAGVYVSGGEATFDDCTISGNSTKNSGGGVWIGGGTTTIKRSIVSGNSSTNSSDSYYGGGGIYVYGGTLILSDSLVTANTTTSYGGGIYMAGGTATLSDSVISGNVSPYRGGGIHAYGWHDSDRKLTLTNCTVSGNCAYGIYSSQFQATINNSIVAKNGGYDVYGTSGAGNVIGGEPGFVRNPSAGRDGIWGTADDDLGDLHLRGDSRCVNAGSNALAVDAAGNPLSEDMDGYRRTVAGIVDVGAYERQLSGDANGDGNVDFSDYLILEASFGGTGDWHSGDFTDDGAVDFNDYLALEADFGAANAAAPASNKTAPAIAPAEQASVFTDAAAAANDNTVASTVAPTRAQVSLLVEARPVTSTALAIASTSSVTQSPLPRQKPATAPRYGRILSARPQVSRKGRVADKAHLLGTADFSTLQEFWLSAI